MAAKDFRPKSILYGVAGPGEDPKLRHRWNFVMDLDLMELRTELRTGTSMSRAVRLNKAGLSLVIVGLAGLLKGLANASHIRCKGATSLKTTEQFFTQCKEFIVNI